MFSLKRKPYKVRLHGRSEVEYAEGDRKLLIGSEFLAGGGGIVLYGDGLTHWDPPHQNEILTGLDIERIKHNVLVDLEEHKIKAEWA